MAVAAGLMVVNPCSKIPGPGAGMEPVDPRTVPSVEQIRDAVQKADTTGRDTLTTMIILAGSTGMRMAEVGGRRKAPADSAR